MDPGHRETKNQLNSSIITPSGQAKPAKRYITTRPPSSRKDLNQKLTHQPQKPQQTNQPKDKTSNSLP